MKEEDEDDVDGIPLTKDVSDIDGLPLVKQEDDIDGVPIKGTCFFARLEITISNKPDKMSNRGCFGLKILIFGSDRPVSDRYFEPCFTQRTCCSTE